MTTSPKHQISSFFSFTSTSKNSTKNSFEKFAKNQLTNTAQKALKGGDGDDDIIIEDTIGG